MARSKIAQREYDAMVERSKVKPKSIYEVWYDDDERSHNIHIVAHKVVRDGDDLIFYDEVKREDVEVGAFRDWKYYRKLPDDSLNEK